MANRQVWVTIGANIQGLQAGLTKAQQGLRDFDNDLQKNAARRQGILELGNAFGKVGLLAAGGLAAVTKMAMDWETAWAGVTKTVDGTDAELAQLEERLREMARTMPATHQEIAAVAEAAGQLGVATADVADFTDVMIQLGETTNLTADEAATSLAQMMNVMQTAPEDVDNLGDALVMLGNNGASTERDILRMAQNLAGAGATIGLSETDVLGLANALASVGIEAEAGGSAVSRILIDMAKAAKTGSPDLQVWADTAGVTADEFRNMMDSDPARAFDAFTKGLGEINDAGGDVFTLLENLGQSDVRVTRALLGMANSGDLLSESLQMSSEAFAENSALGDEYAKRVDTAAAQAQIAWNGIKDNLIDIGAQALPVVKEFSEAIAGLTGWFGDLPDSVQGGILKMMAFTAVLGGGAWAVSRAVTSFSNLATSLNAITTNGDALTRSQLFRRGGLAFGGMGLLSMSDAIGETNSALGALAEIGGATALGFGVAGPWGGLAAGAGVALKNLVSGSDEAAEAQARLRDTAEQVAEAIDQQTGAITEQATELAKQRLAEKQDSLGGRSAYEIASGIGVSAADLTKASLGDAKARARVEEQVAAAVQATADAYRDQESLLASMVQDPSISPDDMQAAYEEFDRLRDAMNGAKEAADLLGIAIDDTELVEKREEISQINRATYEMAGAFGVLAFGLAEAAGGADEFVGVLNTLPDEVKTDIVENGAEASQESIDALAEAYDMTPEEVRTTLEATDNATKDIESVSAQLDKLNGKTAEVRIKTRGIGAALGAIAGVRAAAALQEADGGVLDFYANGGLRENHVAQIAPAGSWRVWAEPETGGEAYIPLAESKRQRSLEIWAETGRRLGVQGYADGGISGGASPMSLSLVGAQVAIDPHTNIATFVRGEVALGLAGQRRQDSRQERSRR